ncbi:hypothetical protein [Nocardia farcinica]|uniref:hypothetical protein n=1 Tax=Nocardia farcinica TaxID=37329 RepID=UPI0022BA1110|nr:hypothetical protein [Nocardia farcinica]MCZ9327577.1 hypothetical protein [Nocardia farcinica]
MSATLTDTRDVIKSALTSLASRQKEMSAIARGAGDKYDIKAFVGAMDSATDASSKYNMANIMKSDAKLAGWPALVGVNAYVNWDDWAHHGKPGDEAIANAVGGIAGGWAGAAVGAQFGAWACAPVLPPFGSAFCAGVGAAAGGLGAGAAGAYFAEQPFK